MYNVYCSRKVFALLNDHPLYILYSIQLKLLSGRTHSDRTCSLHHASIPHHEALGMSHTVCFQIVAATFICSGIDACMMQ